MRRFLGSFLGLVLCLIPVAQAAQSGGKQILIIGDSNTEFGYYSLALMDTLQSYYGVKGMGPGYIPMDSSFYSLRVNANNYMVHKDTVNIKYPISGALSWQKLDMYEGSRLAAVPYLSGNGQWLKSINVGAVDSVIFPGTGVDVYWLADSLGGSFSVSIDGTVLDTVSTKGTRSSHKTVFDSLTAKRHTMVLKVLSASTAGPVILQGFDAHTDMAGHPKRSLVHNWGNGYAATIDFPKIDSIVFQTALQQLSPEIVVILLGTNDYGLDTRSAADYKKYMKVIVNRIKAAQINAGIMLVSVFNTLGTDTVKAKVYIPQYKTVLTQIASEDSVNYWDMNTWFAPYVNSTNMSGVHCTAAGGKLIGIEMFKQILSKFPTTSVEKPEVVQRTIQALSGIAYHSQNMTLTVDKTNRYTIEMFSLNGARVAHAAASGSHSYSMGSGAFAVSHGVYYLRVSSEGKSCVWSVPVLK